ncbi:MAG TPA: ATP-binding protein [Bacillota bacterium]|nr:ATP-binding protein [Bacillota bacterium]
MKKELRVLLLEDMLLDAELIDHELRRAGLQVRTKRVETQQEFLSEIEHRRPDVILSDHGVPAFDGFAALETARQRCPEVPFIFVTGAHGDEVAVETLKRGADDYVLKSRLHQLAPAIQRALRQTAERRRHQQVEAALHQSEELLRLLTLAAKDYALFTLSPEGHVSSWTDAAEQITGYPQSHILEREWTELIPEDDQERVGQALKRAVSTSQPQEANTRVVRKSGGEFPALITLAPLRDGSAIIRGLACVLHDLTAQTQALEDTQARIERTVRQRSAQSEADRRELQQFSYAIALDLRVPLRHIDSFVERLQKTAGDQLNAQGRSALLTIHEAAHQIGKLVDELLTFSRIGQMEMYKLQFSLAELAQEVIQEFRHEVEGRHIEWVVGDLPEVVGDPTLLTIVLTSLLSNALKFTRPRPQARIEVGAELTEREVIVFVADNGIGFDPRYMDKLFGVFQRLHPGSDFEGLGVGLANVRRIVQRHGGRTWAEGALDQGARFYFSLPRTPPPQALPQESWT